MRRIKKFVPVATLETVYKGLDQPYFEYCSPLWETCGKLLISCNYSSHVLLEFSEVSVMMFAPQT